MRGKGAPPAIMGFEVLRCTLGEIPHFPHCYSRENLYCSYNYVKLIYGLLTHFFLYLRIKMYFDWFEYIKCNYRRFLNFFATRYQ